MIWKGLRVLFFFFNSSSWQQKADSQKSADHLKHIDVQISSWRQQQICVIDTNVRHWKTDRKYPFEKSKFVWSISFWKTDDRASPIFKIQLLILLPHFEEDARSGHVEVSVIGIFWPKYRPNLFWQLRNGQFTASVSFCFSVFPFITHFFTKNKC